MAAPEEARYVFAFRAKRKKRPNPSYSGILRTHRFYIEYYSLLEGQEPSKVVEREKPKISFPVGFVELVIDFAKDLGGRIVEVKKVKVPRRDLSYEKPIIVLPNEVAFRRHLLYSLTISSYRKAPEARVNALRNLLLTMNANLVNILSTAAMDRYAEFKSSRDPALFWYMLRAGRAIKVLYKLD